MKLSADRDGSARRFAAKLSWGEKFDPKEIEILSAKAIPMLIPPLSVQGRRNNVILYDISAYSTLDFYLTCILSREQFAQILLQSMDVLHRMQQIYLNYKNLVFDLDKIYVRLDDQSLHFIYLPLMSCNREASIPEFIRKLVTHASRSTYEQSSFLDACISWLDRPSSFVIDEFESFVKNSVQLNIPTAAVSGSSTGSVAHEGQTLDSARRVYQPTPVVHEVSPIDISLQGNTCQLSEQQGGTVLLGQEEPMSLQPHFYLIRIQTNEKIELNIFPFIVGSELGSVSYCVSGNPAVSRRHAEFTTQDGECFITDQKSTNKTYVNDCALIPFTAQPIKDADRIRLANEDFTFVREG